MKESAKRITRLIDTSKIDEDYSWRWKEIGNHY